MFFILSAPAFSQSQALDIEPVAQSMPEWCWAAVLQMTLTHYGVCAINPINYQCGIIACLGGQCSNNCTFCDVPAYSINTIRLALIQYPQYAAHYCGAGNSLNSTVSYGTISANKIRENIDNGDPVIIGIENNQHAVLIIGYNKTDDGVFDVIINDPWPYSMYTANPYLSNGGTCLQAGQYEISFSRLVFGLHWASTLYDINN